MDSILTLLAGLEGLAIILFALGIILIVIEIIMPGFGVAGGLGTISLLVGVVIASQIVSPGVLTIIIIVVLLIITCMLIWVYRSATKGGRVSRLLLLKSRAIKEDGYNSASNYDFLIDKEGTAVTTLRPAGIGEFDDIKVDVIADGDFIPKGSGIKVIKVEGFRIIVTII